MFPDISDLSGGILGVVFIIAAFVFFAIDESLSKRKKGEISTEARKFKDLYSRIRYCRIILEHGFHDTKGAEIEKLIPLLEELGIKTPSLTQNTIRTWKDFLEQLVRLAETETDIMDNLEKARKIYFSTEIEK